MEKKLQSLQDIQVRSLVAAGSNPEWRRHLEELLRRQMAELEQFRAEVLKEEKLDVSNIGNTSSVLDCIVTGYRFILLKSLANWDFI